MAEVADLIKGGEMCISITLSRAKGGTKISAKTLASIEETVAGLGNGSVQEARVLARSWYPVEIDSVLSVYSLTSRDCAGIKNAGAGIHYRIDIPGEPLVIMSNNPVTGAQQEIINMSFLRLTGIKNGVSFIVRSVYSIDRMRELGDMIQQASKSFYISYMKPFDLTVMVSVQEMRT